MFEVSSARHLAGSQLSHDGVLAAAIDACARARATQNQLLMQLWRAGVVSDVAYGAFLARGDQMDADVAVLQARYGAVSAAEADPSGRART